MQLVSQGCMECQILCLKRKDKIKTSSMNFTQRANINFTQRANNIIVVVAYHHVSASLLLVLVCRPVNSLQVYSK